jgi:hypothetical protein
MLERLEEASSRTKQVPPPTTTTTYTNNSTAYPPRIRNLPSQVCKPHRRRQQIILSALYSRLSGPFRCCCEHTALPDRELTYAPDSFSSNRISSITYQA